MMCRYAGCRERVNAQTSCCTVGNSIRAEHRQHFYLTSLAPVKVRSRQICRGASRAGTTVEEAVQSPNASKKESNGRQSRKEASLGSQEQQSDLSTDSAPPSDADQRVHSSTADKELSSKAVAEQGLKPESSSRETQEQQNLGAQTSSSLRLTDAPGRTVRLIRGPGGVVRRANSRDEQQRSRAAGEGDDALGGSRDDDAGEGDDDEQSGTGARRTVRLVRGPRGQMMDARKVMGWVTAADGSRAVCPRCEGRAFIRLSEGGPLQSCPVCQQWAGEGLAPMQGLPERAPRRRSAQSRRPLSEEHKAKIRAAHAGRKRQPLDEEHKRRIAESMKRINSDQEARQARSDSAMGVPKTCAVCGLPGHNKRTCPQITHPAASSKKAAPHAKPAGAPVFKGVTWSSSNGQWRAQAWDGKKIQFIAHFDDPVEAAKAYDVAVLEWRGDRAVTNFPADDYFEAGVRSMDAEDLPESSSTLPAARAQSTQPAKSAGRPAQAEKPTAQPVQERASHGPAASRASDAAPATADAAAQDAGASAQRSSNGAPDAQADMSEAQPSAAKQAATLPAEAGQSETSKGVDGQPDISPLIAMEQSSADVSAADLAGTPAEIVQKPVAASEGSADMPGEAAAPAEEAPRRASTSRRLRSASASASAAGAPPIVFELPMTRDEAVQGAVEGIRRAWSAGVTRQKVELLLPGDTDGRGYPGGIKQQFGAVRGMVEAILLQLKQLPEFQGKLGVRWLDETDCVGAWESDAMAAVVLPTANTLPQLKDMAAAGGGCRLLLVVNPQWQMDGQIVSDFGFGQSRKEAEGFVNSFEDVSVTQRLRIMGDDVRLFRCFPGSWQVHFIWPNGRGALLTGIEKARPSYERLLSVLQGVPGAKASRSWVDRVNPFSRLGGSVSTKELLAAREDAERRAEMGQAGPAAQTWAAPGLESSNRPSEAARAPAASNGAPGSAKDAGASTVSAGLSSRQRPSGQASADDRFGEWDIITGKRVRDLRLEPVLQLAQWQQSLFGSRESTCESLDEDAQETDRSR